MHKLLGYLQKKKQERSAVLSAVLQPGSTVIHLAKKVLLL